MKAITVQQPWAWAIVHGGKDVENRTRIGTWRAAVGTRVAIHAGQRWSDRGQLSDLVRSAAGEGSFPRHRYALRHEVAWRGRPMEPFASAAIIGTVEVEYVHPELGGCCAPWGETSYVEAGGTKRVDIVHLRLASPRPCEPIDCRGALGLWTVPDDIAEQLS